MQYSSGQVQVPAQPWQQRQWQTEMWPHLGREVVLMSPALLPKAQRGVIIARPGVVLVALAQRRQLLPLLLLRAVAVVVAHEGALRRRAGVRRALVRACPGLRACM